MIFKSKTFQQVFLKSLTRLIEKDENKTIPNQENKKQINM